MKSINTNFNIPSPTTSLSVMMKLKMIMTSLNGMNKLYWGDPTNSSTTDASQTPTLSKLSRHFLRISFNSTEESRSGSSGSVKKFTKTLKWALPLSSETFRKSSIMKDKNSLKTFQNFHKSFTTKKTSTSSLLLCRFLRLFSRFWPFKKKSKILSLRQFFILFTGRWPGLIRQAKF